MVERSSRATPGRPPRETVLPVLCRDKRAHGTGVALAFDEGSLPVAGKLPVFDHWRAHVDAEHVKHLAAPVLAIAHIEVRTLPNNFEDWL